MRRAYAILMVGLLGGCATGGPDMGPVGGGLSVIGLAIVVAAFIRAVAGAVRRGDGDSEGGEGDA